MKVLAELVAVTVDFLANFMGHKLYDVALFKDEPSKQWFCTCGGRIITTQGNDEFYWTIVESTCPAINILSKLFDNLNSDFPIAKVVNR